MTKSLTTIIRVNRLIRWGTKSFTAILLTMLWFGISILIGWVWYYLFTMTIDSSEIIPYIGIMGVFTPICICLFLFAFVVFILFLYAIYQDPWDWSM